MSDLEINPGEIHAIMGPNGSGKSTLSSVIAGREDYEVTGGSIDFEGEDLLDLDPEERAHKGIFLSFQYPVEIPGVSVSNFIKTAINESRKGRGEEPMEAREMLAKMREKTALLEMDKSYLSRSLNEGFSGGEKKRNEIRVICVFANTGWAEWGLCDLSPQILMPLCPQAIVILFGDKPNHILLHIFLQRVHKLLAMPTGSTLLA